MTRAHLEAVDVARGLAALSVTVYHHGVGRGLAHVTGCPAWSWLDWPGESIAVPLFFVLSGFCIHLGGRTRTDLHGYASRFLLQRLFRLYPAWLIAVALSAFMRWCSGDAEPAPGLLAHLTLTNGFFADSRLNPVLWSVSVEFMLYLLYPGWLWVRRTRGLRVAVTIPAVVSVVSCLMCALVFRRPTGPTLWFFASVWIGWIAGAVLAEHWEQTPTARAVLGWSLVGIAGAAAQVALARAGFYDGPAAFFGLPISIILCAWPLWWLLRTEVRFSPRYWPVVGLAWRALARVGVWSYSLYLLHVPLGQARLLLDARLLAHPALRGALYLATFAGMIAAAALSYRWIEKPAWACGRALAGPAPMIDEVRRLFRAGAAHRPAPAP
jgi:peptidoglycan/LPS O-acetylase OafA/YrhL